MDTRITIQNLITLVAAGTEQETDVFIIKCALSVDAGVLLPDVIIQEEDLAAEMADIVMNVERILVRAYILSISLILR